MGFHNTKDNSHCSPKLKVDFEVGRTVTLKPKQVVRGSILLKIPEGSKPLCVSIIKIKFKGEETVSAKSKDAKSETSGDEVARTVYFECNHVVWPSISESQTRVTEYCPWREFNPGTHKFDFAVKLPPVNFPPSIEGPKGFSIRYFWKPIVEGSGGTLIEGSETVTLFVPTIFAPPDKEWIFKDIIFNESKTHKNSESFIEVEAILPKPIFSPGEEIRFSLFLNNRSSGHITRVQSSLRKHYEGPLDKQFFREKHERSLVSTEKRCDVGEQKTGNLEFFLAIPPKHHQVPPTFEGHHLRVYYTLRCVIQSETGRLFTKMQYHEVTIPITITPYPHMPHDKISDDMDFPSNEESHLLPFFFDPREDYPPNDLGPHNKTCASLSYDSILSLRLDDYENEKDYSSEDRSNEDKSSDFT